MVVEASCEMAWAETWVAVPERLEFKAFRDSEFLSGCHGGVEKEGSGKPHE